jgi:hypothetical protein
MKDLKDYLAKEVSISMRDAKFDHWLIREFLIELLSKSAAWSGEDILVVRKDPAFAFEFGEARNPEKIKLLSKKLLLSIGFFPENLLSCGKRSVSLKYYVLVEKSLLYKLTYFGEIWRELDLNLKPTIKSLNFVRTRTAIKQPDTDSIAKIVNETGDIAAFYKLNNETLSGSA